MARRFVPFDDSYRVPVDVRVSRGVRRGSELFVCGQMDLDAHGTPRNVGDLWAQTETSMRLLYDVIEKAGLRPAEIAHLHVFYVSAGDDEAYRARLLAAFPECREALTVVSPVRGWPTRGAEVEIDAIVIAGGRAASVGGDAGHVVGAARGDWVFAQSSVPASAVGALAIGEGLHRALDGVGASLRDVCKVSAYFTPGVPAEDLARVERSLAEALEEAAPVYHGVILPAAGPDAPLAQLEVVARRDAATQRLRGHPTQAWRYPGELPFPHALRCGDAVFIGGQLALDEAGAVRHAGDLAGQTHLVMSHLRRALESVGAGLADMTKVNAYFRGEFDLASWSLNVGIRSGYYVKPGPASTGIEVARLPVDGALISADCIALLD